MNAALAAARVGRPPPSIVGIPLIFIAAGVGSLTAYPPPIAHEI